jgi:D-lactate dehydrogenase (cytochrome)
MELVDKYGLRALNLIASQLGRRERTETDSLFFKLQGPTQLMLEETARIVKEVATKHGGINFEYAASEKEAIDLWDLRKHAMHACVALYPGLGHLTTDVWYVPLVFLGCVWPQRCSVIQCANITSPRLGP